jgi:hypothetical protein
MMRPVIVFVVLIVADPVVAADKPEVVAPSAAVAAAWAKEADAHKGPSAPAFNALYGSYGALQTLDMVSTFKARQQGAREVNPVMAGGFGQASARKMLLAAAAVAGVKSLEKKNRKAAFATMVVLNVATAAIVVNNYRNVRQLGQR